MMAAETEADTIAVSKPSGRLGRCLEIIFSVFKTGCAVSRNRALIKRALKAEHSLSRHRFALRHRRLVTRQPMT